MKPDSVFRRPYVLYILTFTLKTTNKHLSGIDPKGHKSNPLYQFYSSLIPMSDVVNQFLASVPFLYRLKRSENPRGYRYRTLACNELKRLVTQGLQS